MTLLPIDQGPCSPWADDADLTAVGCDAPDGVDMGPWLQAATDMLFARSGRQWIGECSITIRPCGSGHPGCADTAMWRNLDTFEWWWNGWGCGCGPSGRCDAGPAAFRLPGSHPVRAVTEVLLDGDLLVDGVDYRVDDWRVLRRLDGGSWPRCQNMKADTSEDGTWSVTYTYGTLPPTAGRLAAAAWACHLAKTAHPGDGCVLPAGVESLSRQSVDIVMASGAELLDSGMTGIELVDQFISAYNPHGAPARARFRSPDDPRYSVPDTTIVGS